MNVVQHTLDELRILPAAQEVYLSLLRDGEATARVIAERTGITRTSVYDQLHDLRKRGLVVERELDGRTYFAVGDVRQLDMLLTERIERLQASQHKLDENLAALMVEGKTVQPKIRFFEGADGVQQMFKDMLWHSDITVCMCFPYSQMLSVLDAEYLTWFNKRRIKYRIALRTIWTHEERTNKKHIFAGEDVLVERRYAKEGQEFSMAYAVYGDKVAFISSVRESYGFLVQSQEFADLMQTQFEAVWSGAKVK